ncbi:hypothetical protein ONZ45_g9369 [Pleurotus djamor]|nr:hypothetical protein ONZ45_g9369 [Pleurotus djamor]
MGKRKRDSTDVQPLKGGVSHATFSKVSEDTPQALAEKKSLAFYIRKGKKWVERATRYRVKRTFAFFEQRSTGRRNLPDDRRKMTKEIAKMHDWPADPYSAIVQSSDGKPLLCVFAQAAPPEKTPSYPAEPGTGAAGGSYHHYSIGPDGHPGRTVDVEPVSNATLSDDQHDGFTQEDVDLAYELSQVFHSQNQPHLDERDVRHAEDKGTTHDFSTWSGNGVEVRHCERKGVTHLAHVWHGQCQEKSPPSTLCRHHGNSGSGTVAFPEYYAAYQAAFDAGVWMRADPGPWIGRAIVYKLQVLPHVDGKDNGPTACFPTGSFSGGEAYFPDLGIKLAYRPRDIIIFFSGFLWHSVGFWKAEASPREKDDLAPGRVGHVHFFHDSTFQLLKDKPPGWIVHTAGGKRFVFPSSNVCIRALALDSLFHGCFLVLYFFLY